MNKQLDGVYFLRLLKVGWGTGEFFEELWNLEVFYTCEISHEFINLITIMDLLSFCTLIYYKRGWISHGSNVRRNERDDFIRQERDFNWISGWGKWTYYIAYRSNMRRTCGQSSLCASLSFIRKKGLERPIGIGIEMVAQEFSDWLDIWTVWGSQDCLIVILRMMTNDETCEKVTSGVVKVTRSRE